METKEAILSTINELNRADLAESSLAESSKSDLAQVDFKDLANRDSRVSRDSNDESDSKPPLFIDIKEEADLIEDSAISDEVSLLLRLKEKSLVLFEGLKATQNKDIEIKLEMVISYLEYQLYVIEDRLKSLESREN